VNLSPLGMGTWHMGECASDRAAEVAALRLGLDLGIRVIDTAEMYAEGGAEEVVGEAIAGRREDVLVVSKFYPHHAAPRELEAACARSLARLGIDRLDVYLCHWRGAVPLARTVPALNALVDSGRIASWGVSNFDVEDLEELFAIPGGERCAVNQVLYNLSRRGIEYDLLPWCAARGVQVMAYSPLDEGPLVKHPVLVSLARERGLTAAQLAIAWTIRHPGVCSIPKAAREQHVRDNAAGAQVRLDSEALAALDRAFPPPTRKRRLEVI